MAAPATVRAVAASFLTESKFKSFRSDPGSSFAKVVFKTAVCQPERKLPAASRRAATHNDSGHLCFCPLQVDN
jgi:hypothetical protein